MDVSFLFADEPEVFNILTENVVDDDEKNEEFEKRFKLEKFAISSLDNCQNLKTTEPIGESRIELEKWIEEAGRDPASSKPTISSLAGYVNIAYPIARTVAISHPSKEPTVFKMEDVHRQIVHVSDNLRRIVQTMRNIECIVDSSGNKCSTFDISNDVVKAFVAKKTTQIVENCELVNALLNIVGGATRIVESRRDSSEPAVKTYGSSINTC